MKKFLKGLLMGGVALTSASSGYARFYLGGQLGVMSLSSTRTKSLKVPSDRPAPKSVSTEITAAARTLEQKAVELVGEVNFESGRDVTFHQGASTQIGGFGVFVENLDEADAGQQLFLLSSVRLAEFEIGSFMNDWIRRVDATFGKFGLVAPKPYTQDVCLIRGGPSNVPGLIRHVFIPARFVTHPALPGFCVNVFSPAGYKANAEGEDVAQIGPRQSVLVEFDHEAFTDLSTFQEALYRGLFENVPGNFEKALTAERTSLLSRVEEGITAINNTSMEGNSKHVSVAVVCGWDRAFFSSKASKFGWYLGVEAFNRFNFGTSELPNPPVSRVVQQSKTSLKTRYVAGVSALPGITTQSGWTFYVPLTLKVTRHSFTFRKAMARDRSCEFLKACGDKDLTTKEDGTWNDRATKWNFGGEIGVGSRVQLTSEISIGIRYAHSFKNTVELESPAYSSAAYGDVERFGLRQKAEIGEHGAMLELLYRF